LTPKKPRKRLSVKPSWARTFLKSKRKRKRKKSPRRTKQKKLWRRELRKTKAKRITSLILSFKSREKP
jgi:hypothetical protein